MKKLPNDICRCHDDGCPVTNGARDICREITAERVRATLGVSTHMMSH